MKVYIVYRYNKINKIFDSMAKAENYIKNSGSDPIIFYIVEEDVE